MKLEIGDTIMLDDDSSPFSLGKMPFVITAIGYHVKGDWGGMTQERFITLEEAQASYERSLNEDNYARSKT